MAATVRIRLYATAREAVGHASLAWEVPPAGIAAKDLLNDLVRRYPALERVARESRLVRNAHYLTNRLELVRPGDDFAIHPPYSGG